MNRCDPRSLAWFPSLVYFLGSASDFYHPFRLLGSFPGVGYGLFPVFFLLIKRDDKFTEGQLIYADANGIVYERRFARAYRYCDSRGTERHRRQKTICQLLLDLPRGERKR